MPLCFLCCEVADKPDDVVVALHAECASKFAEVAPSASTNTRSPKLREILERLEAVKCIVSAACSPEEAKCAWDELDNCIAQLRAGADNSSNIATALQSELDAALRDGKKSIGGAQAVIAALKG